MENETTASTTLSISQASLKNKAYLYAPKAFSLPKDSTPYDWRIRFEVIKFNNSF